MIQGKAAPGAAIFMNQCYSGVFSHPGNYFYPFNSFVLELGAFPIKLFRNQKTHDPDKFYPELPHPRNSLPHFIIA